MMHGLDSSKSLIFFLIRPMTMALADMFWIFRRDIWNGRHPCFHFHWHRNLLVFPVFPECRVHGTPFLTGSIPDVDLENLSECARQMPVYSLQGPLANVSLDVPSATISVMGKSAGPFRPHLLCLQGSPFSLSMDRGASGSADPGL